MNRVFFVALGFLIVGVGCDAPKLNVENVADSVAKNVQTAVQQAAEKGAEEVAKRQTGQDVDLDFTNQGATFVDPSSGKTVSVGTSVTIPANFPSDVPQYPAAKPTSLSFDPGRGDASLLLLTTDGRAAVRDWYKAQASASGWAEDGLLETADQIVLSFKKQGATLTVTVMPPNLQKESGVLLLRKGE